MDDTISRQAAIDYCYQLINVEHQQVSDETSYGWERVNQTEAIMHHLEVMPSAQPMRKRGEWLPYKYAKPGHEYKFHVCSACGCCDEYVSDVPRPNGTMGRLESVRNFCPNCGADMRGTDEHQP